MNDWTPEQHAKYDAKRAEQIQLGFAPDLAEYVARGYAEGFRIPSPGLQARANGSSRNAESKSTPPSLLRLVWASQAEPGLDVDYVVKGLVAAGELAVIYGPPKSGKTFLAMDLALSVAAGLPWFGRRVRAGLVIYIASEMGIRAMRRVRAWIDARLGDANETSVRIPDQGDRGFRSNVTDDSD